MISNEVWCPYSNDAAKAEKRLQLNFKAETNLATSNVSSLALLISALKLSYMECFESNMDPTKMEWQIDAVIRVILSQCYHLGHKHDIRGLEKRLQYALLR